MQPIHLPLNNSFEDWAESKLSQYTEARLQQLMTPISLNISTGFNQDSIDRLRENIRDFNLALYQVEQDQQLTPDTITLMADQLGLKTLDKHLCASEDKIAFITDTSSGTCVDDARRRYIPYSNKALSWHTDGYYNPYHQCVKAFILHCQQSANSGGGNSFLDPAIAYILLSRKNPAYIEALSHPRVMRIPANTEGDNCIRAETESSVFQLDADGGFSAMRFSQRKRHIIWRDDPVTRDALACLNDLLDNGHKWRVDCKLGPGQGVVTNNVLHRREAYKDEGDRKRIYMRARFYNSIGNKLMNDNIAK